MRKIETAKRNGRLCNGGNHPVRKVAWPARTNRHASASTPRAPNAPPCSCRPQRDRVRMSHNERERNRGRGCRIPGMTGTVAQQTSVRRVRRLVVGRGKFRAARRPPGIGPFLRAGVGCIRARSTACVEWRYADFRPTRATIFANQIQGEPPEKS